MSGEERRPEASPAGGGAVGAAVTLTPEESRRLIAKAVAGLDVVRRAKTDGTIGLALCSSAGYVAEELLGRPINRDVYCCGFIHADGWCWVSPDKRGPGEGRVGVLVGDADGGEAGRYLPHILARGIQSIVPMTISKALPVRLDEIAAGMGTQAKTVDPKRTYGVTCGMLPWPGTVVTEIEAFQWLAGASALPISAGGFGSGAGCVSFLLGGSEEAVDRAWRLVADIKGEPPLRTLTGNCRTCEIYAAESCTAKRKYDRRRARS